jgi:hypothetical protein
MQLGAARPFYGKPFWCTAIGKIFTYPVSSSMINDTISYCKAHTSHACAYFFFDGRDAQKKLQMHENLIRSLIRQLSHHCNGLPAILLELYSGCNNGHQEPSVDALQNTLQIILSGFDQSYIMIDSLDECPLNEREKLLNWLEEISRWKVGRVHTAVTSRPERDIQDRLGCLDPCRVCMAGDSENHDIDIYLDQILQNDVKLNRWDKKVQDNMKAVLKKGAQGM